MFGNLSQLGPYLLPLGAALVAFLLMRRLRYSLAPPVFVRPEPLVERHSTLPDTKPDATDMLLSAPAEISRWHVAMHETARDLMAELQTRTAAVQALCVLAEERAQQLQSVLDRAEQLGLAARPDFLAALENLDAAALATALPTPVPAPPTCHPRREEIRHLAAKGASPADIAHQLGLPCGEVELVLSTAARA